MAWWHIHIKVVTTNVGVPFIMTPCAFVQATLQLLQGGPLLSGKLSIVNFGSLIASFLFGHVLETNRGHLALGTVVFTIHPIQFLK